MFEVGIYAPVELDIDYAKVHKKLAEMQDFISKHQIKVKLEIDNGFQNQLNNLQRQLETLKPKVDYNPIKQGTSVISQQAATIQSAAAQNAAFAGSVTATGNAIVTADKHTNSWGESIRRMCIYWLSYKLILSSISQTITTLKDIDTSLTNLSKVTSVTRNEFQQLTIEALEAASTWGRTAKDMLDAQTTFARAGMDNYKQMAELSLIAQAAGQLDENLASSYLIASNKAFRLGGDIEKLGALLDAQNQVSNKAAIDLSFLAEATKAAGNVMMQAGESAQTATAAWTAMGVASQRSGSEVGNASRTIQLRLQHVKQAFAMHILRR